MKSLLRGKSGNRQSGWVVFLTVNLFLAFVVGAHASGVDMLGFVPLFMFAWPTSFVAAIAPHTINYLNSAKAHQVKDVD